MSPNIHSQQNTSIAPDKLGVAGYAGKLQLLEEDSADTHSPVRTTGNQLTAEELNPESPVHTDHQAEAFEPLDAGRSSTNSEAEIRICINCGKGKAEHLKGMHGIHCPIRIKGHERKFKEANK